MRCKIKGLLTSWYCLSPQGSIGCLGFQRECFVNRLRLGGTFLKAEKCNSEEPIPARKVANEAVRGFLHQITSQLDPEEQYDWKKTRRYLYQASHKLTSSQVDKVLSFLEVSFGRSIAQHVVRTSPRILRRSVKTKLVPTKEMLEELYGPAMTREAVQRKPELLLTRGIGYNTHVLDLVEVLFKDELGLKQAQLDRLKLKLPSIFQTDVTKLLLVIQFFRKILMIQYDTEKVNSIIRKLLVSHPNIFLLSVEDNLQPHVAFFKENCDFDDFDVAKMIESRNAGPIFGLSIEKNLNPSLAFLHERLSHNDVSKVLKSHPQILSLSIDNLREKVTYFDSLEGDPKDTDSPGETCDTLASKILRRSPSVYSLSLEKSIQPKVDFLANIWSVHEDGTTLNTTSVSKHLGQNPSVLSLSLSGNIQPTVRFLNSTGYIHLDENWHLRCANSTTLRGRDIATSLTKRLLPRWHFWRALMRELNQEFERLPLHILVSADDDAYCLAVGAAKEDYAAYKRTEAPQVSFLSQFDTWVKTGRPIEEYS